MTKRKIQAAVELLGSKLEAMRNARHWSQAAVAKSAGMHVTQYGEMERAQRNYQVDALIRVLDGFEIDVTGILMKWEPAPSKAKADPEIANACAQLVKVLTEGDEEFRAGVLWNLRRWRDSLPAKE